jgi:predicted Zn-dependent protease
MLEARKLEESIKAAADFYVPPSQQHSSDPTDDALQLEFASSLAKSPHIGDRRTASCLLQELIARNDAYHLHDVIFFELAVVNYSLGKYDVARSNVAELLRLQPDSKQIQDLYSAVSYRHKTAIEETNERNRQQTAVTAAITAVGAIAVAVGFALSSAKKK